MWAQHLAACASLGLITTLNADGFGRRWRLTQRGMFFMYSKGALS